MFQRMDSVDAALRPIASRGDFLVEAKGVLTPEQAMEARRRADEWRAARRKDLRTQIAEHFGLTPDDPIVVRMVDPCAVLSMRLESIGHMVRGTMHHRADARKAQFEDVVRRLDRTPEQAERAKLRDLVMGAPEAAPSDR